MNAFGQTSERRRNALGCSRKLASDNPKSMSRLQVNRTATLDRSGPNFGTAQILKDGNLALGAFRGASHARVGGGVGFVGAVRKVEPDDIDAGGNERIENRVGIGGRTDRRDDLGLPHVESISLWARLFPIPL